MHRALLQGCWPPLCVLCVLCIGGFIFRNWGPLQKVCSEAETHAKPRLPPGAALGCFHKGSCHVTKHKVLLLDDCISFSLHVQTACMLSTCAPTTTPVSAEWVSLHPLEARDRVPEDTATPWWRGFPLVVSVLPTLGKTPAQHTCKPPRMSPVQAQSSVHQVMRDTAGQQYSLIRHILRLPARYLSRSIRSEAW